MTNAFAFVAIHSFSPFFGLVWGVGDGDLRVATRAKNHLFSFAEMDWVWRHLSGVPDPQAIASRSAPVCYRAAGSAAQADRRTGACSRLEFRH